jgi:hypothetical protein
MGPGYASGNCAPPPEVLPSKMMIEAALRGVEAKLVQELTHDGHVPERITPERWKVVAALCREPGELERFFENFLDTSLALALRCTACGRAFLLIHLGEAS